MKGVGALLIVDVQNDFCPGGALPVPHGDQVVGVLNKYIEEFSAEGLPILASRDWHPEKTRHFGEYGGIWPSHCVQGSRGAEFHRDLRLPSDTVIITKGDLPDEDAYSAFQGRDFSGRYLKELLEERDVEELYIGGLATDYCVKATVSDAIKEGFKVALLVDAIKGVDLKKDDSDRAIEEMKKSGARTIVIDRLFRP